MCVHIYIKQVATQQIDQDALAASGGRTVQKRIQSSTNQSTTAISSQLTFAVTAALPWHCSENRMPATACNMSTRWFLGCTAAHRGHHAAAAGLMVSDGMMQWDHVHASVGHGRHPELLHQKLCKQFPRNMDCSNSLTIRMIIFPESDLIDL